MTVFASTVERVRSGGRGGGGPALIMTVLKRRKRFLIPSRQNTDRFGSGFVWVT